MRNILYHLFDFVLILCFMLFGMLIAHSHNNEIWIGALGGLIVHRIVRIILRNLRDYVYGGRN